MTARASPPLRRNPPAGDVQQPVTDLRQISDFVRMNGGAGLRSDRNYPERACLWPCQTPVL
jgi:hypothetical protein